MSNVPANSDITGAATLTIISGAKRFNQWMYEEIKPHLKGNILELGSGTGNISELLLTDNFKTVLSDYNPSYVDVLKKKFSGNPALQNVLLIDLEDPFFAEHYTSLRERFDTIFLLNVIEHIKNDLTAILNCRYMLKQGGRLVLLAPAFDFLFCDLDKNLGHYRRYTIHSLAGLLKENKMLVVEKKYFNLAGITGWFIWGKILKKQQLEQTGMGIFNKLVPLFKIADRMLLRKIGLSAIAIGEKL